MRTYKLQKRDRDDEGRLQWSDVQEGTLDELHARVFEIPYIKDLRIVEIIERVEWEYPIGGYVGDA